ncbi:MAG: alpha/beta hydrolase [Atopobiaceae bacterium]|nr:alpha/beta hydrolase [Atopobiaceae bacterium]MCH4277247.1 alpha/beta hydrolase [Atopobiaceae bacterium]MCI1225900.1 alpha/beta hydrolase [Atopobiaceae bacterium]MCI1260538.1 alpha/beta hydrolase [Atopobiaceae bacterium]
MAKKMAYVALSVVAVTLVVVDALLALGTLWQGLPCIGTFANLLTVGNMQAWVPLVAVVTLVCVLVAHFHGGRLFGALWVVSLVTLACGVYFAATELFSINDSGGDASLLASYEGKADRSDVTMDTERYEDTISDDSLLDVYRVDDGATDKPVVLYVHGGGWSGGSRKEGEAYLEQFAETGYVAVSAEYDLSSSEFHGAATVEQQLTYAVAWIQDNVAAYGGSTDRFYVIGDSAGGNLGLDLAYKICDGTYREAGGTTLPKVDAVSVLYPVTDMAACYTNDYPLFTDAAHQMVGDYMGTTPDEDPELYASLSPINYVGSDSPATCIMVGDHDTAVSPTQSYTLQERLAEAGVDNKLVKVAYANHLFDMGGTNIGAQGYMGITLSWFSAHQ